MKESFVSDGPLRFFLSEEYQVRCRELRSKVAAKYEAELSKVSFFRGLLVRYHMRKECRREIDEITPSKHALWFGCAIFPKTENELPESERE